MIFILRICEKLDYTIEKQAISAVILDQIFTPQILIIQNHDTYFLK